MPYFIGLSYPIRVGPIPDNYSYIKEPKTLREAVRIRRKDLEIHLSVVSTL
jgi:hypothetical protein